MEGAGCEGGGAAGGSDAGAQATTSTAALERAVRRMALRVYQRDGGGSSFRVGLPGQDELARRASSPYVGTPKEPMPSQPPRTERPSLLDAARSGVLVVDGAMGTQLYERGVLYSQCFEELNVSRPDLVARVHEDYLRAGAQVIETNTFGANSPVSRVAPACRCAS